MFVSVVTVCFNSELTIKECIESVRSQSLKDYEHIIIDGGSSDRTLEIIESCMHQRMKVISEPDDGIYDAMNKGVKVAKGDVIHFLNSDDTYVDDGVLQLVYEAFSDETEIVIGDVDYGRSQDSNVWRVEAPSTMKIALGWHPPHPGFFCRRALFHEYGLFDTSIAISADFELMMRFVKEHVGQIRCVNSVTTYMSPSGVSSSLASIVIGNLNVLRAAYKLKLSIALPLYLIFRLVPKVKRKLRSLWESN